MINSEDLFNQIRNEVTHYFDNDEVMFVVVFGSRARGESRQDSDIDLMIVFQGRTLPTKKIEEFKRALISLQQMHGLHYDENYPGEYISIFDITKAIGGYGFVRTGSLIKIDSIQAHQWTYFNSARQWLSALSCPNILLYGDGASYQEYSQKALTAVVLLSSLSVAHDSLTVAEISERLLSGGKEYLGFCNTEYTHEYLHTKLSAVCSELVSKGILAIQPGKEVVFHLNRDLAFQSLPRLTDAVMFEFLKKFLGATTGESDKTILRRGLEIGIDFVTNTTQKTVAYYSDDTVRERFSESIPLVGNNLNAVIDEFQEKVIDGAIHQSSPNYLAFPDSGNSLAALTADILIGFTNQNLIATTKSAPTGTYLEMQVISWLRKLIGFTQAENLSENAIQLGGVMTSGGTMANTTALLVARCKAFPDSRKQGLQAVALKPILIIAADTLNHYSHTAAFWWLGLGEDNIVYVKSKADFRIDCEDLDLKLTTHNNNVTSKVIAVVAQAGDSRTTTIEDFNNVSAVTERHKVWLHVDACHGGVLIFSQTHKDQLSGIEKANSVSIDPHKGLCTPYSSSAVLFRDIADCALIAKSTDITIQQGSSDLGQVTPFMGSRAFDSLKLWFLIKHLGVEGIGALVDYRFDLAKNWRTSIEQSSYFAPLNQIELNSVVFSVSMDKIQSIFTCTLLPHDRDIINKLIHDMVYREGYICIHSFDIVDMTDESDTSHQKKRVLGVTFGNPYTVVADFPDYITYLDSIVERISHTYDNNNDIS